MSAPEDATTSAHLEKVGIESYLVSYLPQVGAVRAKFRIDNSESKPEERFPDGDWLGVSVVARVYDVSSVRNVVPGVPLAQGSEVFARARTDWALVDLPLPVMDLARYAVVAKVYSADDRYRKPFNPSNCFVGALQFGFARSPIVTMTLDTLQDVYAGVGNPLAQAEVRDLVRKGLVIVEDEAGGRWKASEVDGKPKLTPIAPLAR